MNSIKPTSVGFFSLAFCLLAATSAMGDLIPEIQVRQAGLTRNWYTQVQLDASRQHVTGARLDGKTLFVLTSAGRVQALDAESGKTLWSVRVGEPGQTSYGPAAHGDKVAMVSGTMLYVLNSSDGKEIYHKRIEGAPGGSPALSEDFVFVPSVNGRMEAYPVGKKKNLFKWTFASTGNIFSDAIIAADQVVWCTSTGYLYAAFATGKGVSYRFDSTGRLLAPATAHDDIIMVAGANGNVYGIDVRRGKQRWRTSVGEGVALPALSVAGTLYVGTETNVLHALDAKNGTEKWTTPGLDQVVSVSEKHVYAVNQQSDVAVIDSETGDIIGYWNGKERLIPVENQVTDRLYFVSPDGLVQCFHEIGADEPFYHAAKEQTAAEEGTDASEGTATDSPGTNPFAEGFDNSEGEQDPFSGDSGDSDPFTEGGEEGADPFGSDDFGSGGEGSTSDPFGSDESDPFGADSSSDSSDEDDPFADF